MEDYSLLVDYQFCTGCHTCEVACKQEHHFPAGKEGGVKVLEMVHELPGGRLDVTYFPYFTPACSFCASRVKKGLQPACVQHCMAGILEFGPLKDVAQELPADRKVYLHSRRSAKAKKKSSGVVK